MSLERYFTPVQTDRGGLVRRVKQLQFHLDFFMNQGWWGGSWESEPLYRGSLLLTEKQEVLRKV